MEMRGREHEVHYDKPSENKLIMFSGQRPLIKVLSREGSKVYRDQQRII